MRRQLNLALMRTWVKQMRISRRKICLCVLFVSLLLAPLTYAQPQLKKIRMGISTTSIAFLSIYAAQLKGFYRDEGIDLELILMPATLASSAVLTGDIDYNGAVTGVIGAAVQGRPMKVLIFTADRSLQSLITRKEIKEPKDLKGKTIAGSTPGATATLLVRLAAKHFGLDPDRDIAILTMGGGDSARLAALETGIAQATVLSVPISIVAVEKGYRELFFLGESRAFPRPDLAPRTKRSRKIRTKFYAWSGRPCAA